MGAPLNLVGRRFGRLLVTARLGANDRHMVVWACRCDCGKSVNVTTRDLRRGGVVSCGCNRAEKARHNLTAVPIDEKLGRCSGTNLSRLRSTRPQKNNACGVRGVSRTPSGMYRACVYYQGRQLSAGMHSSLEDAARAVDALRAKLLEDAGQQKNGSRT